MYCQVLILKTSMSSCFFLHSLHIFRFWSKQLSTSLEIIEETLKILEKRKMKKHMKDTFGDLIKQEIRKRKKLLKKHLKKKKFSFAEFVEMYDAAQELLSVIPTEEDIEAFMVKHGCKYAMILLRQILVHYFP